MGVSEVLDLPAEHRAVLVALLEEHLPGTTVWAYGSRVKWTSRPSSDLDLVVFASPHQGDRVGALREALEDSDLPFRVDLFVWNEVPDSSRERIKAEHVILAEVEERPALAEWRTTTLGDVVTLQRGFDLPTTERKPGPYPVIASTGTVGTHHRAMVHGPGVVLGRSGSLGGGQYIKRDFWPLNTTLWVKDFQANDPRFCSFLLQSLNLKQFNAGSGVPTLNRNHIHPLPVHVPPLAEQRAIASVLGVLDDRVELSRRMNETLEAMARGFFKSWFVDFDPVRAKMEGRDPKLPPEIADSFPDRLVESELGEIPEGWNVLPLDAVAVFRNGLALQKFRPAANEEWLPVLKIAHLRRGHTDGVERARASIASKFVVDDGDIVFSWSGSLELRIWTGGRAALNQHLFKVGSGSHPKWFVFRCIESHLRAFRAIAAGKATTMGHIKREHLREALCVVPDRALFDAVRRVFEPLVDITTRQSVLSRELDALRDTLLPKLVSGDIRLPATLVERYGATARTAAA